jgi:hypothetical protein
LKTFTAELTGKEDRRHWSGTRSGKQLCPNESLKLIGESAGEANTTHVENVSVTLLDVDTGWLSSEDDVIGSLDASDMREDVLNVVFEVDALDVITELDVGPGVKVDVGSIVVKLIGDDGFDVVDVDIVEDAFGGLVVMVVKLGTLELVDTWMVVIEVARGADRLVEMPVRTVDDVSEAT